MLQAVLEFAQENWREALLASMLLPFLKTQLEDISLTVVLEKLAVVYDIDGTSPIFNVFERFHMLNTPRARHFFEDPSNFDTLFEESRESDSRLSVANASYWFRWQNTWVYAAKNVDRVEKKASDKHLILFQKNIRFYFLSLDSHIVERFREDLLHRQERSLTHTSIKSSSWSNWMLVNKRLKRAARTLYYPNDTHLHLRQDLEKFYASESEYHAKSLVHKRGYLLHGPPGNGKTTLLLWLAAELNLELCIISTRPDAEYLLELFISRPRKSLLVLEDIDAIFPDLHRKKKKKSNSDSSLGIFLNVLDGVYAQDGQVIVMTTNHIEDLDPALIRRGRVDQHVFLDNPSNELIQKFWNARFSNVSSDRFIEAYEALGQRVSMSSFEMLFDTYPNPDDAIANIEQLIPPSVEEASSMVEEEDEDEEGEE